jgi:hypothetical protein
VVEMGVRDHGGIAMGGWLVAIEAGYVRQCADAQEAGDVKGRAPGDLEELVFGREALAEIEEDAAVRGLDEDLVSADFAVTAIDNNLRGQGLSPGLLAAVYTAGRALSFVRELAGQP